MAGNTELIWQVIRNAESGLLPIDDASFGSALPLVNSALPLVGSALPLVGSALPLVGSALPSVGSALPSVGSALPSVGSALPSVGFPNGSIRKKIGNPNSIRRLNK
jgi:hypothetical protein